MIVPAFQSIFSVSNQNLATAEVLSRWVIDGESHPPGNNLGSIQWGDVDLEIILMLIKEIPAVRDRYQTLMINVSQQTLESDSKFITWLTQLVRLRSLSNLSVIVEITEQVDELTLRMRWDEISHKGFDLALDDYGKLNSTFERLQSFAWSVCKLDVRKVMDQSPDALQCLQYCQDNKITIIGEQVENKSLSIRASEAGIDLQQGFIFSHPHILGVQKPDSAETDRMNKPHITTGLQGALQ